MLADSLNSLSPLQVFDLWRSGSLDAKWIQSWTQDGGTLIAGAGVAWSIGIGATLTAGFGHVRRWKLWLTFGAAFLGLLVIDGLLSYTSRAAYGNATSEGTSFASYFYELRRLSGWLLVGMIIAIAGAPLGRLIRRGLSKGDARRWDALRRRLRRRRFAV